MDGAAKRAEVRRAEMWTTAMMPRMKNPVPFEEFTGIKAAKTPKARNWEAELGAWQKFAEKAGK